MIGEALRPVSPTLNDHNDHDEGDNVDDEFDDDERLRHGRTQVKQGRYGRTREEEHKADTGGQEGHKKDTGRDKEDTGGHRGTQHAAVVRGSFIKDDTYHIQVVLRGIYIYV